MIGEPNSWYYFCRKNTDRAKWIVGKNSQTGYRSCFIRKNVITWVAQKRGILPSSIKLDHGQLILSSCLKSACMRALLLTVLPCGLLIKKSTKGKILYNIMLISIASFLIKSISIKTNMIIHVVIRYLWICLFKKCTIFVG